MSLLKGVEVRTCTVTAVAEIALLVNVEAVCAGHKACPSKEGAQIRKVALRPCDHMTVLRRPLQRSCDGAATIPITIM